MHPFYCQASPVDVPVGVPLLHDVLIHARVARAREGDPHGLRTAVSACADYLAGNETMHFHVDCGHILTVSAVPGRQRNSHKGATRELSMNEIVFFLFSLVDELPKLRLSQSCKATHMRVSMLTAFGKIEGYKIRVCIVCHTRTDATTVPRLEAG